MKMKMKEHIMLRECSKEEEWKNGRGSLLGR